MANSLIPAFNQIRLSGLYTTISGDNRLKVGTDIVLYARDSGNLGAGNAAQTGALLYNDIVGLSGIVNNDISNLTTTGQTLYNDIINASGLFVQTGSILSFYTGLNPTGFDNYYINFLNYSFPSIPRVQATLELSNSNIVYAFAIMNRSTTGFNCLFSDVIAETGVGLNVEAKSN